MQLLHSYQQPASLLLDLLRGILVLEELLLALAEHRCGVMHAEELGHPVHAALLLVASIDLSVRFELREQVGLLA